MDTKPTHINPTVKQLQSKTPLIYRRSRRVKIMSPLLLKRKFLPHISSQPQAIPSILGIRSPKPSVMYKIRTHWLTSHRFIRRRDM